MSSRPALLVVYDIGSLAPTRLGQAAARNDCDLVFVAAKSEHARQMLPTLELVGSVVDMADHTEAELLDVVREVKPVGILTFSEVQIATAVWIAAELGLPYHSPDDLDVITHKDLQRQRFVEAGVDSIRFRAVSRVEDIDSAITRVGLPAIVKPVIGASSRNTVAVTTAEQARAVLTAVLGGDGADGTAPVETSVLLEELLVGQPTEQPWGDYIAVDCVVAGGEVHPVFVTSKFALAKPFRERGGYGGFSVVSQAEVAEVRDLACRAVAALNVRNSLADVEIKLTPSGPRVIEVNGRLGAWVDDLAVRSGSADPADTAVKCALGREFDRPDIKLDGPIAFDYLVVPPFGARTVRGISNVRALRELRNVDRVTVLTQPGASVDWRIGATGNVASVAGVAQSHDQLAETVAAIEAVDWIGYE